METDEYEEDEFGNPHPINVTEELLSYLNEKIYIQKVNFNKSANKLIIILFYIFCVGVLLFQTFPSGFLRHNHAP